MLLKEDPVADTQPAPSRVSHQLFGPSVKVAVYCQSSSTVADRLAAAMVTVTPAICLEQLLSE